MGEVKPCARQTSIHQAAFAVCVSDAKMFAFGPPTVEQRRGSSEGSLVSLALERQPVGDVLEADLVRQ